MDTFSSNVALVFFPFHASMVHFSSLPQLLDEFGAHTLVHRVGFLSVDHPWDRCDFYVGQATDRGLSNVTRFFGHNGWHTDGNWAYDVVLVVGYNNLSNMIVDIPAWTFPWCINYMGVVGEDLSDIPFPEEVVSSHTFSAACESCFTKKSSCLKGRSGACPRCTTAPCVPQVAKELDNLRTKFVDQLLLQRPTLCPAFQYLLASCGTRYGYSKAYSAADKAVLRSIVEAGSVMGRDVSKEAFLRERTRASQLVMFKDGQLSILEERGVNSRLGFTIPGRRVRSKTALGFAFPNFGLADPLHAYSLMNSALSDPGGLFVVDVVAWDSNLVASPVRLVALAQFESVSDVFFMVGWV